MNQTIQFSLKSESEAKQKFIILYLQDLKAKLKYIVLPDNWLVWHDGNSSAIRFIFPHLNTISVDLYLEINSFYLYQHGSMDKVYLPRLIKSMLFDKLNHYYIKFLKTVHLMIMVLNHIHFIFLGPKEHIEKVIELVSKEDRDNYSSSVIAKLQFILCRLDNIFIPKNRRRYL